VGQGHQEKVMETPNQSQKPTDPNWWQAFFEGPFGRLQVGGAYEQTAREEVDLITGWLNLAPTAKILDAPSGDGRIARELARRGYPVTAVDFNPGVLEKGRALAQDLPVDFIAADIRELRYENEFDAAISWWTSYGYFSDEDNVRYLAGLQRALKPGGRLILDTIVAESLYPLHKERGWQEYPTPEGLIRVLEHRTFDFAEGRILTDWTFLSQGREEHHHTSIRLPTFRDLVKDLRSVGFTSFEAYERPSGKPFKLGSPRLSLIAGKG
jgi:SAM-dependent methyltransferase